MHEDWSLAQAESDIEYLQVVLLVLTSLHSAFLYHMQTVI